MACKTLGEYGFNNFSLQTFCLKGTDANQISVKNATKETASLDLLYSDDLSGLVPNGTDLSTITPNIKLTENLSAPIFEGTNVGTITYSIDGSEYSCSLIASHNVYKSNFVKTLLELLLLIFFLFIFAKFLHYRNTKQNKRKKSYNKRNNKRNYINNFYPTYKN